MQIYVFAALCLLGAVAGELVPLALGYLGRLPLCCPPEASWSEATIDASACMLAMMAWRSGVGASVSMLAPSVPLSYSSSYASESGYSSYPIFPFALSVGRVRGFCPLPTVAGRPVFAISSSLLACLSWEAEGGSFLASSKISKKSSRRRGCDQGSGVPSTLSLYFSKICLCAAFAVLGRGLLAQLPGDWETF